MNIRSISILLSVIFFSYVFSGCNKTEDPVVAEESLVVMPINLNFSNVAESKTFGITSNSKWTISRGDADWISFSAESGEGDATITVTVAPNTGTEIRNGKVTVTTEGGLSKEVAVQQGGTTPFILIDPDTRTVIAAGEEVTIEVTAYAEWEVVIPPEINWVTLKPTPTATEAILIVAANPGEEREATIDFKLKDFATKAELELTQDGMIYINITPTEKSWIFLEGEFTVTVDIPEDGTWDIEMPAGVNWVTKTDETATTATFKVDENEGSVDRTAEIVFKLDGTSVETKFTLTQDKFELLARREFDVASLFGNGLVIEWKENSVSKDHTVGSFVEITYTGTNNDETLVKRVIGGIEIGNFESVTGFDGYTDEKGRSYLYLHEDMVPDFPVASISYVTGYYLKDLFSAEDIAQTTKTGEDFLLTESVALAFNNKQSIVTSSEENIILCRNFDIGKQNVAYYTTYPNWQDTHTTYGNYRRNLGDVLGSKPLFRNNTDNWSAWSRNWLRFTFYVEDAGEYAFDVNMIIRQDKWSQPGTADNNIGILTFTVNEDEAKAATFDYDFKDWNDDDNQFDTGLHYQYEANLRPLPIFTLTKGFNTIKIEAPPSSGFLLHDFKFVYSD